jgi:hypothetical protein
MQVICEHAEQCATDDRADGCWHTTPHEPLRYALKGGRVAYCEQSVMKCTATGKQCRCVPAQIVA